MEIYLLLSIPQHEKNIISRVSFFIWHMFLHSLYSRDNLHVCLETILSTTWLHLELFVGHPGRKLIFHLFGSIGRHMSGTYRHNELVRATPGYLEFFLTVPASKHV